MTQASGQVSEVIKRDNEQNEVSPLKISISNSDASRQLVAKQTPDKEKGDPMDMACDLVHALLDQVAWNDAPPSNEDISQMEKSIQLKTPRSSSRQCHVDTKSQRPARILDQSTSSDDPSDLWNVHYSARCTPAEQRMGNVTLATLCARTLETVGKSSLPSNEEQGLEVSFYSPDSPKRVSPWRRRQRPKKTWLRRKNKKNSTPSKSPSIPHKSAQGRSPYQELVTTPESAVTIPPGDQAFFGQTYNERKSGNSPTQPIQPTKGSPSADQNRLQMFGSEYARYLSTTPLAPKESFSAKGAAPSSQRVLHPRRRNIKKVQLLEDAEKSILTGPITDLIITHGEDVPPKGYYRVSQSAAGDPFFLRDRKSPAYINIKKETNWDRAAQRPCVTALALIFPERKEFVPPGFSVVRHHTSTPQAGDVTPANLSVGGEAVFLCFRRSREGNPITALVPLHPSRRESVPEGFTVLERTPRNHVACIQTGTSSVFLAYRQRLANLEPLRPLPLVMSVHNGSSSSRRLTAYYSTGGTVVESRVGRFHIMDRATHSLLSPSSVSNRLCLIEASRRKTLNSIADLPSSSVNTYSYSGGNVDRQRTSSEELTSSLLLANGLSTPGTKSVLTDLERLSSLGDFDSFTTSSDRSRLLMSPEHDLGKFAGHSGSNASYTTDEESFETTTLPSSPLPIQNPAAQEDKVLKKCLEALSFIPVVSSAVDENDPRGMLHFQARVSVITPVLTACYTRHGGSALLAVEGLTGLLENDFFVNDVNSYEGTMSRITLLDIAVQAVCDLATTGSQETHLHVCVEFVEAAVKYSCGHLNIRSIGYILRFYLFVFFFGVSSPVRGSRNAWGIPKGRDRFLLDDPRLTGSSYLPGGAPQAAVLSLKDLITYSVARLRSLATADRINASVLALPSEADSSKLAPELFYDMIDELVGDVVDMSVYRVDIANFTQLAMHQIYRSGGSELFWYDMMNSCGAGLFGSDDVLSEETRNSYALCFALLANCVKVASTKIRRDKQSEGIPRDISSKLMSLEMIYFFLEKWEEGKDCMHVPSSKSHATFTFCIRRLVSTTLLGNTRDALDDPRVYRRVIRIVGLLWCTRSFRTYMKLEIGILMEQFVLKVLRLGPQILRKRSKDDKNRTFLFAQQLELMREIKHWFADDHIGLLELFLNFDTENGANDIGSTEILSGIQWKITEQICSLLSSMCEKCGEFLADQIRESQSGGSARGSNAVVGTLVEGMNGVTLARESAERLRKAAFEAISGILLSLGRAAAKSQGSRFQNLVSSWNVAGTNHIQVPTTELSEQESDEITDEELSHASKSSSGNEGSPRARRMAEESPRGSFILGYWQKALNTRKSPKEGITSSTTTSRSTSISPSKMGQPNEEEKMYSGYDKKSQGDDDDDDKTDHLRVAFDMARNKSLNKAIDYLIACNILTPSPRDIASFLRIHKSDLKPSQLGKYLAEGGVDVFETEHWNLVRFSYVRAISFVGMTVEQGLRHLLTNGGFRLPGEAQEIDRILTAFAQCYWEDNAGDMNCCPFQDQDTVFLLSFAIIMLNTDLHKYEPPTTGRKSQRKRMTKSEFLNNLRGVTKNDVLNQEYLSAVYVSIEARPIVLNEEEASESSDVSPESLQAKLGLIVESARSSDALLRGLSIHEYRFVSLEEQMEESRTTSDLTMADIARRFMLKTWHQFHSVINSTLESAHLDPKGLASCMDVLKFCLCISICLDLPLERTAFLGQLGRFRLFTAWQNGEARDLSDSYRHEDWYKQIQEAASSGGGSRRLLALDKVHEMIINLGINHVNDTEKKLGMKAAVRQLQNGDYLMNDPTRVFLRQGDLLKRANRSGRNCEYRFFLFSDVLLYAKQIPATGSDNSNKQTLYKIHEELPLILMKIVDWFPRDHHHHHHGSSTPARRRKDTSFQSQFQSSQSSFPTSSSSSYQQCAFQIYHPRKKFMVYCKSNEERKSWVENIRYAIEKEMERKISIEAARISVGKKSTQ